MKRRKTISSKVLILAMVLLGMSINTLQAQTGRVGINTEDPKATLHIATDATTTNAQGILVPRLSAQQLLDMQVATDHNALLVYMTEPVPAPQRIGAFSKVDNRGFYHYFADANNSANNYWKKIIEIGEHVPIYNMVQQVGIDNDLAINNYYATNVLGKYDVANFVVQNYLGTPANPLPLPHTNLSATAGRDYIGLGGMVFKAKLGAPYDDNTFPQLNTAYMGAIGAAYWGIDQVTNKPKTSVELYEFAYHSGIFINEGGTGRIVIKAKDLNSPILLQGKVKIGSGLPTESLDVDGKVKASSFISSTKTYPDYVFEKYYKGGSDLKQNYTFKALPEVEAFIKENGHLPGYKAASEVVAEGSFDMSASHLMNVEKIEELYLHTIEQGKELKTQSEKLKIQSKKLKVQSEKLKDQQKEIDELKVLVKQLMNK